MVFGIGAVVDNLFDGLGYCLFHLQSLAQSGQGTVPFVFAINRFLKNKNCELILTKIDSLSSLFLN